MTKEKLVQKIRELLKTDNDLGFLLRLKKEEIETFIACIRDRVDQKWEANRGGRDGYGWKVRDLSKSRIIYQSKEIIHGRHTRSKEWIEYSAVVTIKDSGKQPVSIEMTFDSYPPFAIELPDTHNIKAANLTEAYGKVVKFLKLYGFEFKWIC